MAIIVERKSYYKIGEISKFLELEPHVIRYWESVFSNEIRPETTGTNRKLYTRSDLEMFAVIRYLVREAQFSMDGARTRIAELRQTGELADLKLALIEYEEKQGIGSLAALSQLVSNRNKTSKKSLPVAASNAPIPSEMPLAACDETPSYDSTLQNQPEEISSCENLASGIQAELNTTRNQLSLRNTEFQTIQNELKTSQEQLYALQQEFQMMQ